MATQAAVARGAEPPTSIAKVVGASLIGTTAKLHETGP
jgi:hypothetical protein